jgi:hypothetical protein
MSISVPRQRAGQPSGGEFARHDRPESTIGLVDVGPGGMNAEQRRQRALALEHGGFVPAIAGPRLPAANAAAWWSAAYVRAEHQPEGQGFYKIGDLWNSKGDKRDRRMRRQNYALGGVQLTMPSVAEIKRTSANIGHETFDMPVSASYPGGDVDGWVRVTRNGPGEWSVQGMNMDPKAAAYATEAISALLESRTVTSALTQPTDLMARRKRRFAQGGIKMTKTEKSAFISGVGYNDAAQTMAVKIGNRHYSYRVGADVFKKVRGARSPGAAYNILVKGQERSVEITSCANCGNFSATAVGHRCPSKHRDLTVGVKPGGVEARGRARGARV